MNSLPKHVVLGTISAATAGESRGPVDSPPHRPDQRRLLVLPQPLAGAKWLSPEAEAALFEGTVERLVQGGYSVVWKSHPRRRLAVTDRLEERFGKCGFTVWPGPADLPIECSANALDVVGCVSALSSSMLYLQALFGIPAYTLAGQTEEWMGPGAKYLAGHFARTVPGLDALLEHVSSESPS